MTHPLEILGSPGSPYSMKMLAYLRYRQIPHQTIWTDGSPPPGYPKPPVALLPTVYFRDESGARSAHIDSTPIIRRLEIEHAQRRALPPDPVCAFLNDLIEDFADEWITKIMFHYRWGFEPEANAASRFLIYWSDVTQSEDATRKTGQAFKTRQQDRLSIVGSNATTREPIEASWGRVVKALDQILQTRAFLFGDRPSSSDFAVYGQLTQLGLVEARSSLDVRRQSSRLRAWIDRLADLSGLTVQDADWSSRDAIAALNPVLMEIGRTYAPVMRANAEAGRRGDSKFETRIDNTDYAQPVFPYQIKCLTVLHDSYMALTETDRKVLDGVLDGTGCEALFEDQVNA